MKEAADMSTLDALVERAASSGTRVVSVACAADSGSA